MYRPLAETDGNVLGYYCSGTLTQAEVKEIHRQIRATLAEHGKLRLLVQIGDLEMPTLKAVWEDLKLTPEYVRDVERLAVVGHESWHDWFTRAAAIFSRGDVRYFPNDGLDGAWEWLKRD